jgi:hypothetical protein
LAKSPIDPEQKDDTNQGTDESERYKNVEVLRVGEDVQDGAQGHQ